MTTRPESTVERRDGRGRWSRRRRASGRNTVFGNPVPWLIVAVVLLLAFAWWPSLSAWYIGRRYDVPAPTERTSGVFHALTYDGGAHGWSRGGAAVFREHLKSMREAGFTPVGLSQVRALYREGRLLPPRAVLITVDGIPASRWGAWRRSVITARAHATAFVEPGRSPRPSWSALRRAQQLPHWDVGVRYAELPVPAAPTGEGFEAEGPDAAFDSAMRFQRLYRLREAAVTAHQQARTEASRRLVEAPVAMAMPPFPADAEQRAGIEVRRHILADTASAFYELSFQENGLSLNSAQSDPMRLNRLRVSPDWSGSHLVRRLRAEGARDVRVGAARERMEPAAWIPVLGQPDLDEYGLHLKAPTGELGDGVWLAGSAQEGDFSLNTSVALSAGTLRVLFMASPDEYRRWELRLSDAGEAEVRRTEGGTTRVVSSGRFEPRPGEQELTLRVRGSQAWIDINGKRLFGGWVPLRDMVGPGRIGFRVEGRETRPGNVHLASIRVGPPQVHVGIWDLDPKWDAYALAWIGQQAGELGVLSPPLDRFGATPDAEGGHSREELYRTISRLNRWALVPHVHVHRLRDLDRWTPDAIHSTLAPLDCDGLLVRLDAREDWSLHDLTAWVRRTAGLLQGQGRRFYLGIPDVISTRLTSLPPLATIPGVQLVVGPDASAAVREASAIERRVPASELETDLQQYFELVADRAHTPEVGGREDRRRLRDEAEAHFAAGEFEEAVTLWFDWHEQEPEHPLPLRRIGDALHRMGYRDEAVDFYQQSLERDPGNIELAVAVVHMLDAEGARDESRRLLQTYSMLFPEEPAVLLAQAEWLFRRGRLAESHERVRRVLAMEPDHVQAALLMAHLAREPEDRRAAIEGLGRLGRDETARLRVLQTIRDADLLTMPEAQPLVDLVLRLADLELDAEIQQMVRHMLPRIDAVETDFSDGALPSAWILDGGTSSVQPQQLRIRAVPGREEVLLRLGGSDRWRDAFVEVEVESVEGDFWIMLRRSRRNLIRYGFDEALGQMLLQIWEREGETLVLKDYRADSWTRPSGAVRLRLDVRGGGIVPMVNGRVWSTPPLPLPPALTPGWVAIAIHSPEPGRAQMQLRRIAAGPLYPSVARLQDVAESELEAQATGLRRLLGGMSALSPAWFQVGTDGAWVSRAGGADHFHRLFARYHGLRLLPEVLVSAGALPRGTALIEAASIHDVDGFVLVLDQSPSAARFRDLRIELAASELDVLVVVPDPDAEGGKRMLGLGMANLLFPGLPEGRPVHELSAGDDAAPAAESRKKGPVWFRL